MPKLFSDDELWRLRNKVNLRSLLIRLQWPHKSRGKQLSFVCPCCGESRSDENPRENLLRCFHCETNFNPIDFTMEALQCSFLEAVDYLQSLPS